VTATRPQRSRERFLRPGATDLACALVAVAVLTGLALLLVAGHHVVEGPVLFVLFSGHGLHAGDLLVAAGWAAGVAAVVQLLTRRRR
jgi:hypothetical protein